MLVPYFVDLVQETTVDGEPEKQVENDKEKDEEEEKDQEAEECAEGEEDAEKALERSRHSTSGPQKVVMIDPNAVLQ